MEERDVTTWMQHVGTYAHLSPQLHLHSLSGNIPPTLIIPTLSVIKVKALSNWRVVSGCEQMIGELGGVSGSKQPAGCCMSQPSPPCLTHQLATGQPGSIQLYFCISSILLRQKWETQNHDLQTVNKPSHYIYICVRLYILT